MVSRRVHRILVILLTLSILNTSIAPLLSVPVAQAEVPSAVVAAPRQQQNTIVITGTGFSPAEITIQAGESVTWLNQSQATHTLKDGDPPVEGCGGSASGNRIFLPLISKQQGAAAADSSAEALQGSGATPADFIQPLRPGESFTARYDAPGTFFFHLEDACQFVGSVLVQVPATPTFTPTPTPTPTATPTTPGPNVLLAPIGNQTAPLGSTLTLQLRSDRSAPIFDVAPVPLPTNASFDIATGIFRFEPSPEQIGNLTLTFSARDGQENAVETITITVPQPDPNAPTALRGRIVDANDAEQGVITPLVGATVKHIESGVNVTTNSDGYFEMSGLQPGENYFEFNGNTAQPAGTYGAYRAQKVLIGNVTNVIDRPIYIMAIDTAGQTQVDPQAITVVNNPNLTTTMTIPAHAVINDAGAEYSGPISISEVPDEFTPGSLPDWLDPGLVMTIQPMGLTFNQPAPISFPNFDKLAPGSEVELWSMDHETARFFVAGKGRVRSDGTMIDTFQGGIRESSWHFPMPPSPAPGQAPDNDEDNDNNDDCQPVSSSVGTADGCLRTSITLPAYQSLDEARALSFVYSSRRAWPQPLIPFQAVISSRGAVPRQISYNLANFGGKQGSDAVYLNPSTFSESRDEAFRSVIAVDGANLQTGVQPYQIRLTSHFANSNVSGDITGRHIVVNEQASPFGAGWGMAGLSRLQEAYNGGLLLVDGDGSAQLFGPQPLDLRGWTKEGGPSNGRWTVAEDGQSVLQEVNLDPTFFVSPDNFINTTIRGTFRVETANDVPGDFIGFVFGYQSPFAASNDNPNDYDFLLFSWKEGDQTEQGFLGAEGFSLSRVKGTITNYYPNFWGQTASPEFEVLDTDFGPDKGWSRNTDYDFELRYSATRLQIFINGQPLFDLAGDFQPGRFGFYNYSQERVRYKNFSAATETARFVGPKGDFSTISKAPDGSYIRRMKDGTEFRFNPAGLQTAMVDRNGNTTTYAYDGQRRLTSITDPLGKITVLAYAGDRLRAVTDPTGRITTFTHDGAGNLVQVAYPDSSQQGFGYDARHLMTSETDRRGNTRTREYDAWGRLVQAKLPENVVRPVTYSQSIGLIAVGTGTAGNPAPITRPETAIGKVTDGEGRTTSFTPGALGRPVRITDPAGFSTTITRDSDGNPLRTQLPSSAVFERTFDNRGNVTNFIDRTVSGTTNYLYNSTFNQVTRITDPLGSITLFAYDNQGNLTEATTPLGRKLTLSYDSRGLPVSLTDPLGTQSRFVYDASGNLAQLTAGTGVEERGTALAYTPAGYIASTTDALGRVQSFSYDALGRITGETLPGNRTVAYGYDGEGNLVSLTPPGRPAHQFEYDGLGQVTAYIPPAVTGSGATRTTYSYNKAQQLTGLTRPDGVTIGYAYDTAGRLSSQTQPRGALTFSYSSTTGQISAITAPENVRLNYSYRGELLGGVTWSGPVAGSVLFTYDRSYRVTQDNVKGNIITYAYDADDALTRAGALTLAYNATNGLLTGTSLGQVSDQVTYNAFGELASYKAVYQAAGGGTIPPASLSYETIHSRDKLGRITQLVEKVNDITVTYGYGYDAAGRLAEVQENGTPVASYTYDANGNRLTGPGGATGTYDDQDRLLSYGGATYSYTANGELQTKVENGETTTYNYDVIGNLMGVTLSNGTQIAYVVDGQDRRIGKRVNGTLIKGFLYQDQLNPVAELDGSGNLVSRFVYGSQSHVPDYMVKGGVTYRIISDHLGSVRFVVNSTTGEILQQLNYDAWGKVLQDSNPGFQPFGFAGGLYDTETGLVRFGARDYDAVTGRWTTKDPIGFEGEDTNLYTYVGNDPVNLIDPSGEIVPVLLGIWAAVEIGLAISDAYSTGQTLADPCASFGEKALSGGLFILGAVAPGGGYSTTARLGPKATQEIAEGIYEFTARSGKPYVGQSGDINRRLQQHIKSGKLDPSNLDNVQRTHVPGGKTAREIAEQQRIDQLGGIRSGNLENKVNPIGPSRRHLLE